MSSNRNGQYRDNQRSGMSPKMIAGIVGVVLLVWFIIANSQEVNVTWWVFSTQTSLIVVILLSAILGAAITFFFTRIRHPHNRDRDASR